MTLEKGRATLSSDQLIRLGSTRPQIAPVSGIRREPTTASDAGFGKGDEPENDGDADDDVLKWVPEWRETFVDRSLSACSTQAGQ